MTEETNPYNCSPEKVEAYDGLTQPNCRMGRGCAACWAKYKAVQAALKAEGGE